MKEYNNELANLDNVEILGFTGEIESIPKTLKQVEDIRNSCCDVGIIQLMNERERNTFSKESFMQSMHSKEGKI